MKHSFIILSLAILSMSVSASAQRTATTYQGDPRTDSLFVRFVKNNIGKIVYLKLSISDGDFITEGYKGVQPYFEGKKTAGINYSFFLECKSDENLTPIEECREARWKGNPDGSGVLSGFFKISKIVKTSMRNYRAVFLIPVKKN